MTGTYIFDRKTNDFVLRKGPIFCQVLLADEVNRAPAKTQSALLEAMQENQVTIEGTTLPLPQPFMVLATQNPVEQEGVYRLPEAQLDRFLLRVEMGYPGPRAAKWTMLKLHSQPLPDGRASSSRRADPGNRRSSCTPGLRRAETLLHYIVDLAEASRRASRRRPRRQSAGLALPAALRRARALLDGRHYFTHEDVQAVARACWAIG